MIAIAGNAEKTSNSRAGSPSQAKAESAPALGPFEARDDLRRLISRIWEPVLDLSSDSNACCRPGETGAVYDNKAAALEGFCRPLWGVLACAAHGEFLPGTELIPDAIRAGVDPRSEDFWGDIIDEGDQRCVEMGLLGWALLAAPDALWGKLSEETQDRLAAWLNQINGVPVMPGNNWRFFRILVNLGLARVKRPFSREWIEKDLALIESCYLGDGWYSDGRGTQRDYYIAMAMHFYGLLIAAQNPPLVADYTERYRERARLFAPQFMEWFVPDGSALPYGRSLIYRFAQGAFWAALAWAGEEALPWGTIKGLLLRHLRAWLAEPIFDQGGVLSIGYRYPNLNMAESYNSPASPYWAMKALLVAGLPKAHPFWRAQEEELPALPGQSIHPHAGFILRRHDAQRQITALASGQFPEGWHLRHAAAKYAKFAYSTRFGFSVPVGSVTLEDGAYDNALALSDDGRHWRVRERCLTAKVEGDLLVSTWSLWPDVSVHTWLFFDSAWQVRVQFLKSGRHLFSAEAGHAVPRLDLARGLEERYWQMDHHRAAVIFPDNAAGLLDPRHSRNGSIVLAAPNSNLLHPRTVLPTLRGEHAPGMHWLVTLLPVTCRPEEFSECLQPDIEVAERGSQALELRLPSGRKLALNVLPDDQRKGQGHAGLEVGLSSRPAVAEAGEDRESLRLAKAVAPRVSFAMSERDWNCFFPGGTREFLSESAAEIHRVDTGDTADPERWRQALQNSRPEVLVTGWSTPPLPSAWIASDACPLKYVCHVTGTVRQIVPREFLARGGRVTNWGAMAGREVAEHALLLALAALRRLPAWRRIDWSAEASTTTAQLRTRTLYHRRVGLHGFGNVARSLVQLLKAFDTEIHAFSDGVPDALMRASDVMPCPSLAELFSRSEIVFECEALTPRSFHSVNADVLGRLRDGGVFVNVGRGQIVEEDALLVEAASGRLQIASDVTEAEPLSMDSPLAKLPDTIISPHIAGPTYETFPLCGQFALRNLGHYLRGEPLLAEIDLEAYDRST